MDSKKSTKITKLKSEKVYNFAQKDKEFKIFTDKIFKDYLMKWLVSKVH